jgi:hypothetical protein
MRHRRLTHNGSVLPATVWQCESFLERASGLLTLRAPIDAMLLYLPRCSAIHTFGMRYRIDVAFTDSKGHVLRCIRALEPRRCAWQRRATSVWEMRAGLAEYFGITTGSHLGLLWESGC